MTAQATTLPAASRIAAVPPPRLLDQFRQAALARGDSQPTADVRTGWARAFILLHNTQHPTRLGLPEVTHFLEYVVKTAKQPLPALAMARSALMLLYATLLGRR